MISIWKFLENIHTLQHPKSEYVDHPEFESLYIRKGIYYFDHKRYEKAITIANITALKENQGSFSKLIKDIRKLYPDIPIFVELVHSKSFISKLLHLGFTQGTIDGSEITFIWDV